MADNKFDYTYSAPTEEERNEIQAVVREYSKEHKKQDALSRMRELDRKVRKPADIAAYVLGVAGTLILGIGMSMCMQAIGGGMIAGCAIGIAGILLLIFNYKIHRFILNRRKKKYGGEILAITEKLLNEKK